MKTGPALAPSRIPVLRGGRLTKWKGEVASCAPVAGILAAAISLAAPQGAQAQDGFLTRAEAEALRPAPPVFPDAPILYNEPLDINTAGTCGPATPGGTVNCSPTNVRTDAQGRILYLRTRQLTVNVDDLVLRPSTRYVVEMTGPGGIMNVLSSQVFGPLDYRSIHALYGATDGGGLLTIGDDSTVFSSFIWSGINDYGWDPTTFDADGWATAGTARQGSGNPGSMIGVNRNVLQGSRGDVRTEVSNSLITGSSNQFGAVSSEQFGYDGLNHIAVTDSVLINSRVMARTARNFASGMSPNTQDTLISLEAVDAFSSGTNFGEPAQITLWDSSFGAGRLEVKSSRIYQFRNSSDLNADEYRRVVQLSDRAPFRTQEVLDFFADPKFGVSLPDENPPGVVHILSSDIFAYLDAGPGLVLVVTGFRVAPWQENSGYVPIPGTDWWMVDFGRVDSVDIEVLIDRMPGGERSRLALLGNSVPGSILVTAATLEANVTLDVLAAELYAPEGSTALLTFTAPSTMDDTYLSTVTVSGDTKIWGGGHILEHILGDLDAQFIGPDLELEGTFSIAGGTVDLLFDQVDLSEVTTIAADYDGIDAPDVSKTVEFRGVSTGVALPRDGGTLTGWSNILVSGGSDFGLSGTLEVGSAADADTGLTIDETSRLRVSDGTQVTGNLNNFGAVDLSGANPLPGTVLTVTGNYAAASDLLIDVVLGDDSSAGDRLVVGGATSGTTNVFVTNVGGTGAQTITGIQVVDVGDAANSTGTFVLANGDFTIAATGETAIIAGAYAYALRDVDGDWYLQSSAQPAAASYEAMPTILLGLNRVGTLAQRIEGRQMLSGGGDAGVTRGSDSPVTVSSQGTMANAAGQTGAWLRIEGERVDMTPTGSVTGLLFEQSTWRLQGGLDVAANGANGTWVAGINLFTGGTSVDVTSATGIGAVSTDALGVGLSATYFGNAGFYTDIQLQYSSFESDLSSSVLGSLATDLEGEGLLASIEMGQAFSLRNGMRLVPQAQLTWSEVSFDSFTGPNAEIVSIGTADSLQLRLGVAAEQSWEVGGGDQARLYGIANVTREMRGTTGVLVDGTELAMSAPDWVGEIGLGGSYDWTGANRMLTSLYGEVSASRALSGGAMDGLAGSVGLRVQW